MRWDKGLCVRRVKLEKKMRKRERDKRAGPCCVVEYDEMNVDDEQVQEMAATTGLPSTLWSGNGSNLSEKI